MRKIRGKGGVIKEQYDLIVNIDLVTAKSLVLRLHHDHWSMTRMCGSSRKKLWPNWRKFSCSSTRTRIRKLTKCEKILYSQSKHRMTSELSLLNPVQYWLMSNKFQTNFKLFCAEAKLIITRSRILKSTTRTEFSHSPSWRWWWRTLVKCQRRPSCCGWWGRWGKCLCGREALNQIFFFQGEWRQSVWHNRVQRVFAGTLHWYISINLIPLSPPHTPLLVWHH